MAAEGGRGRRRAAEDGEGRRRAAEGLTATFSGFAPRKMPCAMLPSHSLGSESPVMKAEMAVIVWLRWKMVAGFIATGSDLLRNCGGGGQARDELTA